jgi:NADH-quinone oxidoreductase subunit L
MTQPLWLIPALPLAGFLVLALGGSRLPRPLVALTGVGSVALSALLTILAIAAFGVRPPEQQAFTQSLWRWFEAAGLDAGFGLHVDALALTMMGVITVVGFLIHLYSIGYMAGEEGYARFFACMNLFVGAMLILVMADNLLMLYLGWEGVGLCSYLLIGFWYREPQNGYAARKAFVVTRVGDTAMAIGLFLLFDQLGSLHIQELMARAEAIWEPGTLLPTVAALLLLGGAVGKSAQLPLQTWLPDAMAGPTPVSALIHAATMVTAGVYLIARTHVLFALAPAAMTATAVVGALTLLLGGASALCQSDIKRVLAYSTVSQIGYMFLALGVGAWTAAMFHFVTHAFFKALLFLGAGAVIHALSGEQELSRMGGLRRKLPLTFACFLAGAAALAAVPLIASGFYSKDLIIWEVFGAVQGNSILWLAAVLGAFITVLYTVRMVLMVFEGPLRTEVHHKPGLFMTFPMVVLAIFSLAAGFVETPPLLGGMHLFSDFLHRSLPGTLLAPSRERFELVMEIFSSAVVLLGLAAIWSVWRRSADFSETAFRFPADRRWSRWAAAGWGFDRLYDLLFVRPYVFLSQVNRNDVIDTLIDLIAAGFSAANRLASASQTGRLRHYAAGMAIGAAIVIAMVVWL